MTNESEFAISPFTPAFGRPFDVWRRRLNPLEPIFKPKSVAVIGATEKAGSVGRSVLSNLISQNFQGTVYPINPKRSTVLGVQAYPGLKELPEKVDLAVIVTPASTVPALIRDCVENGVKGVVIISAGFKELGAPGVELENQIRKEAAKANLRIIGPNCLGVMNPSVGLNATFASRIAYPGNIAFISQSGALCTAVLDWSIQERIGFSAFVSIGSMLDVSWADLIDYLGHDPDTKSILLYMETVGDARAFLSAAREAALNKPIIVLKVGRTQAASKAAASHTGALTGSDEVLDVAFKRAGVLRVKEISELFNMADLLATKQPLPKGPRLVMLTNAGGPGVLATDALITSGGTLADLSQDTMNALNTFLPPHWSRNNPVDVLGDADADRYAKAVDVLSKDPACDGVLVILTPQAMTEPVKTADALKVYSARTDKPILASWMGGSEVQKGKEVLNAEGIPVFAYPDEAARMFQYMWHYTDNLRTIYETPKLVGAEFGDIPQKEEAFSLIQKVLDSGRTILTESESKELLSTYKIPTVVTKIARDESEVVKISEEIGYPVVLKIYSETITHKTDVGGVKLNLNDADSVRQAYEDIKKSVCDKVGAEHFLGVTVQPMIKLEGYEIILGSNVDSQFGPVMVFGAGGKLVEIFKDRALAIPPINSAYARRLMEETRIFKALKGFRGEKPADLHALERLLVNFSQLIVEQKWIKEIDINPILVSHNGITALDARVILYPKDTKPEDIPRPAIRPYPAEYIVHEKIKDDLPVTIRPIRAEDEPLMVKFHESLSENSVRQHYFHEMQLDQRTTHARLIRICFNDFDRSMAVVAETRGTKDETPSIIAVARLSRIPGSDEAEFTTVVEDKYQGRGLGTILLKQLLEIAKKEKISHIFGHMLPDNTGMQEICTRLGCRLTREKDGDSETVVAHIDV